MDFTKKIKKNKQLIVAEIGQSHDGSLNYVHSFIDECHKSGADVIKFQAHFAEEESTLNERFRTKTSHKNETRFDYWRRMQFTNKEWFQIYKHVKSKKLLFSTSVFSDYAINFINKIGIDIWKISSGESISLNTVKKITEISNKPIFVSTGMSYENEIDNIYRFLKKKNPFLLMHCVSKYPTKYNEIGINIIEKFKRKYRCPIGFSDHSGTVEVPLTALSLGINAIEIHVVFDKKIYNPDSSSSITFDQLKQIRNFVNTRQILLETKIEKNQITKKLKKNRKLFSKSFALKQDMKKGQIITTKDLILKKPGNGISEKFKKKLVNKKLIRNKSKFFLLKWKDIK